MDMSQTPDLNVRSAINYILAHDVPDFASLASEADSNGSSS
jgi:hypothetical protein